jgi:hypothetical protein
MMESEKKKRINWHEIIQEILDKHLPLMSGKEIEDLARERQHLIRVDYYCAAKGELPESATSDEIRPFDHLKARNIIEYKSFHEVLNEALFRHYAGRALAMEWINETKHYQGKMTLTILTTHKPKALLKQTAYHFQEIFPWKYSQ